MGSKLAYLVIYLFSKMPFWVLYRISDFVAFILNYVFTYRKDVVIDNLKNSFPEKSEKEIISIWKQFNRNFADQIIETLKMFTISEKEMKKRLVYVNKELLDKYVESGKSVMLSCGHYGNYEYPAGFPLSIKGFKQYNVVYAPLNNKFINDRAVKSRSQFGVTLLKMKETMKTIASYDSENRLYGFLFDQSPHFSRVKYDLMFLNQRTPVHLGSENVARMHNAAVLYFEISRIKRGYYQGKLTPITDTPNELPQFEITRQLFAKLEETINRDPSQWLWSHKRWKYKPGIHYNLDS